MRYGTTLGVALLLAACSDSGAGRQSEHQEEAEVEVPDAPVLAGVDVQRVCRGTVAALNGHDPSIMEVTDSKDGIVRIRYARPSDGKIWTNECRIEGERVIWRTVDAFGPGSGLGRWRTHPDDEVITYKLTDGAVQVTMSYSDGSSSTETYKGM